MRRMFYIATGFGGSFKLRLHKGLHALTNREGYCLIDIELGNLSKRRIDTIIEKYKNRELKPGKYYDREYKQC